MSKHTPGPWTSEKLADHWFNIKAKELGRLAELKEDADRAKGDPELRATLEADARLIAAAPDLLEVLKDLEDPESGCRLTKHALESIRAAIAKAEGKP